MTISNPLEEAARLWVSELAGRGMRAAVTDTLENGLRALVERGISTCRVNLYFSRSRGFSVIFAGGDRSLAAAAALGPGAGHETGPGLRAGMDEAGKGDYFGPLVAAAVCLGPEQEALLRKLGLADSKTLSDNRILDLEGRVKESASGFSVAFLDPPEYNAAFEGERAHGRNSLDMLAALHGRALKRLLETCIPETILLDKFCSAKRIAPYLPCGAEVELRTGAESDAAVAAASILARAEYVKHLRALGERFGIALPAGSSAPADEAGCRLVSGQGSGSLYSVAKLHFRNTRKILEHTPT